MSDPILERFYAWAANDRGRSPNTLIRYKAVLEQVSAFGDPISMDPEQIQDWWDSRIFLPPKAGAKPEKRAHSSRSNELACLRTFYKWATKFDLRADDPTRRLDAPPIPNKLPRMIGTEHLELLLGEATKNDLDLRRAFALGAYGGLRISEAAAQDWSNIRHNEGPRRMFVRGKGLKERAVPISTKLWDYLLPVRSGNVITGGGEPYSAAVMQRKINRLMTRNGIDNTFHDLRKRGASIALANGASITGVMKMFGWSSAETVKSYAVVEDDELDRIAAMIQ